MFLELRITDSLNMLVRKIDWFFSARSHHRLDPRRASCGLDGEQKRLGTYCLLREPTSVSTMDRRAFDRAVPDPLS
jgi:hypothetical protein